VNLVRFEGREVIHGQGEPGVWHTFTGPKSTSLTGLLIGQVLEKAAGVISYGAEFIFKYASAAEAIGRLSDRRETIKKYSGREFEKNILSLPRPSCAFCCAKISFGLSWTGTVSEPVGILLEVGKRTIIGQYKKEYHLLEFYLKEKPEEAERSGKILHKRRKTNDNREIISVIYKNSRAFENKDLEKYMSTIHEESPYYVETKRMFEEFIDDGYEFKQEIKNIKVINKSDNEAKVEYYQITIKISGPSFNDNEIEAITTLRKSNGEWKIYTTEIGDIEFLD